MPDHDATYKAFFSHKEMLYDLVQGYIPEIQMDDIDWSSSERVSESYIARALGDQRRYSDIVWKVRLKGKGWVYMFLLLEFQSRPERWMAVRIMTYTSLLLQRLIDTGELPDKDKLPPMLPIVLYNGDAPWKYSCDLSDAYDYLPEWLRTYQIFAKFILLDQKRLLEAGKIAEANLVSAVIQIEHLVEVDRLPHLIQAVLDYTAHKPGLQQEFLIFLQSIPLTNKLTGVEIEKIESLTEFRNMLAENIERWEQRVLARGIETGIAQGIETGMARGIDVGKRETLHQTLQKLLQLKFGGYSAARKAEIEQASVEELERWLGQVLKAENEAEAFV